jgi:hypothetical protein
MKCKTRGLVLTSVLVAALLAADPAFAQKQGGILRVHALDSPPSLSMLEEVDAVPARATMELFKQSRHVRPTRQTK